MTGVLAVGLAMGGFSATVGSPAFGFGCVLCAPSGSAHASHASAAKKGPDAVRSAVKRAVQSGSVAQADGDRYLSIYRDSARLRDHLSGQRRAELSYVVVTTERIARAGRLNAARMRPLFLILDRNREWWAANGPPGAGARMHFGSSPVIFQYYPGRGLQLQPLANFGIANGLWQAHRDRQLRSLIDDLVALRVNRGGFASWEYYFHFDTGSPPWISGMAQATAMQALARASKRFDDPSLLAVARSARGAFEQPTPLGVRVSEAGGAWYVLYSFAPRLEVLNGMLQALIGLNTYVSYSGDAQAGALFEQGDRLVRARIAAYDTGAWSLYSRVGGRPGAEANLNYHTLNRDFARRLCTLTAASPYCTAADDFTRYLQEDPDLRPFGPAPAPAVAGRGIRFHFTLSKVSRVGIAVKNSARTYLSTSGTFGRGRHWFRWIPPRAKRERVYDYQLFARDLAGNTDSQSGTIRVKAHR
jgi:hypothetical protein